MEIIRLSEMLQVMKRRDENGEPVPFSITFVTCNQKLNTGGEKITFEQAVLVGGPSRSAKIKNPNHHQNFTRNIMAADGDQIITIHPILATRFNGMGVSQ